MSNVCDLLVIYFGFWPKNGSKSLSFHRFGQKFDDVSVALSLNVLPMNFFTKLTLILSYFIPKFVKIEYDLHG